MTQTLMEFSVTVEHLTKAYGDVKAVNDISFSVKKGSLFAFLGVNGARQEHDDQYHLFHSQKRRGKSHGMRARPRYTDRAY